MRPTAATPEQLAEAVELGRRARAYAQRPTFEPEEHVPEADWPEEPEPPPHPADTPDRRYESTDDPPEVARTSHLPVQGEGEPVADFFVDWTTFWDRDRTQAEWLIEDVLAYGRAHSIYAGHKVGKSLFALAKLVELLLSNPEVVVVYLDYEMGGDDLYERLEEMGYGPATDLGRLHYALLPSLPPLDTADGAVALMAKLDDVQRQHPGLHLVVVIDTTSRAVAGEENSADTIRAFYRHTGLALKQRGATWARLDHAGKDQAKGQRGTSAKGDDVDVVWRLSRTDTGIRLHRDASRMSWVPAEATFNQHDDPLRFTRAASAWPAGTAEVAALLDTLGVPVDTGWRGAATALRHAGEGRRAEVIRAAVKYRKNTGTHLGTHPPGSDGTHYGTHPPENGPTPAPDPLRDPPGPTSAGDGDGRGSLKGTHPSQPTPDQDEAA